MNGGSGAANAGGSSGGATTEAAAATGPSESTAMTQDSLTLALQAIQGEEAAARLSPTDGGYFKATDGGLPLLENTNSRSRQQSEEQQRPASKRASSLKLTSRQSSCPEGNPASKKAVRFADAMGLDLALVRHVLDLESPPNIPAEATRDLVLPPSDDEFDASEDENAGDMDCREGSRASVLSQQSVLLYLSPAFAQPGSAPNFNSRITSQKVVLEKAYYSAAAAALESTATDVSDCGGEIRGLVRVANLGFEKSVRVRATFDGWRSSVEIAADFQPGGGGGGGGSDQFAFTVRLPAGLHVGDRVALCVAYSVCGQTYWDSNFGDNYSFHCVALDSPLGTPGSQQVWTRYV